MWMETTLVTKESSLEDVAALFGDYVGYGMVEEERNGLMALTFFAPLEEGEDLWLAKENWISSVAMKLKEAGFLEVKREGKWAYYALTSQAPLQALFIEQISKLSLPLPPKISACEIKGEES